jgi:hypothetical protein
MGWRSRQSTRPRRTLSGGRAEPISAPLLADAALGEKAGDGVQERGLPGAVRADDAADLAGGDLQGEVVHRQRVLEEHHQTLDLEEHQPSSSVPR